MAARIAVNRTVAGVHFPCDSAAGAVLGLGLGRWIAARALGGSVKGLAFDAVRWGETAPGGSRDFHLPRLLDVVADGSAIASLTEMQMGRGALLSTVWKSASEDWGKRWG
jgi:hypothetical protein